MAVEKVPRKHPSETGDTEAVPCPNCNTSKVDPQYGSECKLCQGAGYLSQQRFNPQTGQPIRVVVEG